MTKTKTTNFDKEMAALSIGVYNGKEKSIPKDWIKVSKIDNENSGFHGEAFYKEGKVIPEAQAKEQAQTGGLIYVNSYVRSDGTEVRGYYRSK